MQDLYKIDRTCESVKPKGVFEGSQLRSTKPFSALNTTAHYNSGAIINRKTLQANFSD
ncbi:MULTISPECIES: hypothetical protein [unclassified Microcoleus]|uniref:hypothetical protein n=1 Tax=unclassified Microcoleus TaxID=2642155 RepID=UPI002FD65057